MAHRGLRYGLLGLYYGPEGLYYGPRALYLGILFWWSLVADSARWTTTVAWQHVAMCRVQCDSQCRFGGIVMRRHFFPAY